MANIADRTVKSRASDREALPPILIVEDVEADRYAAARLLGASFENPIMEAADGQAAVGVVEEALAKREDALPCLVLVDLRLPKMSGEQFLKWCGKVGGLRDVAFAVLTNYGDEFSVESGANQIPVFAKPLNAPAIANWLASDLRVRIEQAGGKRRITRSNIPQATVGDAVESQKGDLKKIQDTAAATRESIDRLKKILRDDGGREEKRKK